MSSGPERAVAASGALAGLAGVALSAVAAHVTGPGNLDLSARFFLMHAPALVGLAALIGSGLAHRRLGLAAATLLALGLVLFCGDLAVRATLAVAPVPMAAPTGGLLLVAGWALLGAAALLGPRARRG